MSTPEVFANIPSTATVGITVDGNYLYACNTSNPNIAKINLVNTTDMTKIKGGGGTTNIYGITSLNGNLYTIGGFTPKIYKTDSTGTNSTEFLTTGLGGNYLGTGAVIVQGNIYYAYTINPATSGGGIGKASLSNPSGTNVSNWATTSLGAFSIAYYNNNFYVGTVSSVIYKVDMAGNVTVFTSNISISSSTSTAIFGLTAYKNFLYVSGHNTSTIYRINLSTPTDIVEYAKSTDTNIFYNIVGLAVYQNYLYIANNLNSNISRVSLPANYIPYSTVAFDPINTKTVASGNLQVRITDPSNSSINEVYYQYAVNYNVDASFTNTFVVADVSPYTFFIPSILDISNTIYVRASNTAGNSAPAANLKVIVYQTPRMPPQVTFTLVNSGNVQVSITETSPPPYYYLNNVSYFLYAYNTFGGNNLSGNTSLSIYNTPVGILSNTNSAYGSIVSYVNTGLSANIYTMNVIARNTVGVSTPFTSNIQVLTTPNSPSIDAGNTKCLTSGNLTISINDTVNNSTNGVYYVYSLDGINYTSSGVFRGANTKTTFTVSNTGNILVPLTANTYTLYVIASNSIGNSSPVTSSVNIYTNPLSQFVIDTSNTQCTASGILTVYVNDTVNTPINGIYYLYSTDGITYGNSGVFKSSGNTVIFNISNTGNAQIPLTANIYTIYVAAANPLGNTISTSATAIETVYTTPNSPTIDQVNTKSITSGNLNVAFTDTTNTATNAVEYTYFIHDFTGAPLFFV